MTDKPDEKPQELVAIDIEAIHPGAPRNYPVVLVQRSPGQEIAAHSKAIEGELVDYDLCPICHDPRCPFMAFGSESFTVTMRRTVEAMRDRVYSGRTFEQPPEGMTPEQRTVWKARRYAENYGMGAARLRAMADMEYAEPVIVSGFGRAAAVSMLGFAFTNLERMMSDSAQIIKGRTGAGGLDFYNWDSQAFSLREIYDKLPDKPRGWKRPGIPTGKELPTRQQEPLLLDNSPRSLSDLFNVARVDRQQRRKKRK